MWLPFTKTTTMSRMMKFVFFICICLSSWQFVFRWHLVFHSALNYSNIYSEQCEDNTTCVDLQRFKTLLNYWPRNKPKGAICFLVQATASRLVSLKSILSQVEMYFTQKYQYPIIIFHEKDLNATLRHVLRNHLKHSLVFFQEIQFHLPPHLEEPVENITACSEHTIGYRHMCRFHAKLIYQQEIIMGLQYLWRLDDDSVLSAPILDDPFTYMRDRNLLYGWHDISLENDKCIIYLTKTVEVFMEVYRISASTDDWKDSTIFYNNFEISNIDVWRTRHYQNYIDFLDLTGGIFYHRWGDAPIKTKFVKLFLEPDQLHQFDDIQYSHQDFGNDFF